MDLDIKKDLASNWFKLLQDAFCNDIEALEDDKDIASVVDAELLEG